MNQTVDSSQPADKPTEAAPRKKTNPRTRAREFALQGLYQFIVGKNEIGAVDAFTRDLTGFHKADAVLYDALLHGCAKQASLLDEAITPLLDRPLEEISPIERAVMWMGVYELQNAPDVPWRVVLNEYVELSKSFGGTDGHKYVNAVLHSLAKEYRATEVNAQASRD